MKLFSFISLCYILVSLTHITSALDFVINPDESLPFEQKVIKHGYPVEKYKVTTKDNYILTIYRIPHGINEEPNTTPIKKRRSPVLLVPGMGVSASYFIAQGKYRALPYYLADRGFDVWIQNTRGNMESQGHLNYDLNKDKRYWNYTIHELGVYDLTANIDFIINKTNQKPFLIGHSQGTTDHFIACSELPEYNDKIKMAIAYAPSIVLHHMDIPVGTFVVYLVEVLEGLYRMFDIHEAIPYGRTTANMMDFFSKVLCSERTYFRQACINAINIVGSHPSAMMDDETVGNILGSERTRFSAQTMFHSMQISKSGKFAKYNYGPKENLRRYGKKTPPEYNLEKCTAPVAIFYAPRDDIVTVKGALETIEKVPNVVHHEMVPFKDFNHIDFILGNNASSLVYEPTIQLMKAYDEGRLANRTVDPANNGL